MRERIERVTVLGAGTMGHALALEFALHGLPARLYDVSEQAAQAGLLRARDSGQRLVDLEVWPAEAMEAAMARLSATARLEEAVADADYALEAVTENLEVKQDLFARVDSLVPVDVVIASNTSSLLPTIMAARMAHPERLLVTHYVNPPLLVPLVEVVPGQRTDPAAVEVAVALLTRIGKQPVRLRREIPGFAVNRLQGAIAREALYLVDAGVLTVEEVDRVLRSSLARRWSVFGALETMDMNGLDIWRTYADTAFSTLANTPDSGKLLKETTDRGDLGVKTGRGFYEWTPELIALALRRRDRELVHCLRRDREEIERGEAARPAAAKR